MQKKSMILHEVLGADAPSLRIIGTAPSPSEAIALVPGKIITMREDPEHPQHFDIMTKELRQFTLEPTEK